MHFLGDTPHFVKGKQPQNLPKVNLQDGGRFRLFYSQIFIVKHTMNNKAPNQLKQWGYSKYSVFSEAPQFQKACHKTTKSKQKNRQQDLELFFFSGVTMIQLKKFAKQSIFWTFNYHFKNSYIKKLKIPLQHYFIIFCKFSSSLERNCCVVIQSCSGPTNSARSLVIKPDSTVSMQTPSSLSAKSTTF